MTARALIVLAFACISCGPEAKQVEGNRPPLPVLEAPEAAAVGEAVTISIDGSDDLEGIVAERQILFGDGSEPAIGYGEIDHVYQAPGIYLIEAYLKDEDGAPSRARRRIIITE
jgi:PKD domain